MSRKPLTRKSLIRKPLLVLLAFLLLWLAGIAGGEPQRVLEQAIRICFSCIGIG